MIPGAGKNHTSQNIQHNRHMKNVQQKIMMLQKCNHADQASIKEKNSLGLTPSSRQPLVLPPRSPDLK